MINLTDKTKCCGCGACAQKCPKNAITMQADEEGFLYPQINRDLCISCGLCDKACPVINTPILAEKPQAYAAKHNSDEVKLKSSSGGIFTALAEKVLEEGGIVFGAGFDKDWNVCHQYAQNLQELDNLRRSKYVQSNIGQTFKEAETFLKSGCKVLFTGTPCQIAGLKSYLGKEYENLLTADIICHASPSPKVWELFLNQNLTKEKIKAINFREKHFGWKYFYLSFLTPQGLCAHGNCKRISELYVQAAAALIYHNSFLKAFLQELINRPSCHSCSFKGLNRASDFTLGDLWGEWGSLVTKQDRKFGISALLINTEYGKKFLTKVSNALTLVPVSLEQVAKYNSALNISTKTHPKRAEFFARYKTESINQLINECLEEKTILIQIYRKIISCISQKKINI